MADFEAIFVDVGEGDSTLLRLPGEQWCLVDIFRCEDHGIDLFKLLDDRLPHGADGKRRLDYLVITHAHDDHIRGLKELVDTYEVGEIWAPRYETSESLGDKFDEFKEVMDSHDNVVVPKGSRSPFKQLGDQEQVTVRCFSPPGYINIDDELTEQDQRDQVHEFCGVFKFDFAEISVMFAGDSDLKCWKRVIDYYRDVPDDNDITTVDSTVLHASHHGSRTFFRENKDDDNWVDGLEKIDPEAVVVSVGAQNKHGHPHELAMKAYRDHVGSDNLRETMQEGTIVLEVEADGSWQLLPDEGDFEDNFGWDDDDGDDDGDDSDGGGQSESGQTASAPRKRSRARLDNQPAA